MESTIPMAEIASFPIFDAIMVFTTPIDMMKNCSPTTGAARLITSFLKNKKTTSVVDTVEFNKKGTDLNHLNFNKIIITPPINK